MRYILIIALAFCSSVAFAGNSNFYSADGAYLGTMAPAGKNSNFIYGQNGSLVGSTAQAGNSTFFYDAAGGYAGQVTNSPLATTPND
jgi:hypothetical protein